MDERDFMSTGKLRHLVIFCLKHDKGSAEEKKFLKDIENILTSIPVVKNFETIQQVSTKNDYDFGIYMEFDSDQDYKTYDKHPIHLDFVENRWRNEVKRHLVIDFKAIKF